MKKKANRALSLLLSVVMCIGLLPASAFAAKPAVEPVELPSSIEVGGTVYEKTNALAADKDFIICSGTNALNNAVTSRFYLGRTSVTVLDGRVILNPADAIVWTASADSDATLQNKGNSEYLSYYLARLQTSRTASQWNYDSNSYLSTDGAWTTYINYNSGNTRFGAGFSATATALDLYAKKDVSVTVTGINKPETGSAMSLVASTTTVPTGYVLKYFDDATDTWTTEAPTGTKPGDYEITVALFVGDVDISGEFAFKATITDVSAEVTGAPGGASNLIYNGADQDLVTAGSVTNGTMQYKVTTEKTEPDSTTGFSAAIPQAKAAGTYYVWYYAKGSAAYLEDTAIAGPVEVTIGKANATVTVEDLTIAQGANVAWPTAKATGNQGGDVAVVEIWNGETQIDAAANLSALPAGTYTIKGSVTNAANYNIDSVDKTLTVLEPIDKSEIKGATSGIQLVGGQNEAGGDSYNTTPKIVDGTGGTTFSIVPVFEQGKMVSDENERKAVEAKFDAVQTDGMTAYLVELNLYVNEGGKLTYVKGAELSKEITVTVPFGGAVVGKEYNIYHWDGSDLEPVAMNVMCARNGELTITTKSFSPFVIVGPDKYYAVTFSTGANYNFIYPASGDVYRAKENEDYTFKLSVNKNYIPTVYDGLDVFSLAERNASDVQVVKDDSDATYTIYTITLKDVSAAHNFRVQLAPVGVTTYTVTYHDNGATGGVAPTDATEYVDTFTVKDAGTLVKDGYTFEGWATSAGASTATYLPGDTRSITADLDLYPVWKEIPAVPTYTVTFSAGTKPASAVANIVGTAPTMANRAEDDVFALPSNPFTIQNNANGTSFVMTGWYDGTNTYAPGSEYTMPANAVAFTAQWVAVAPNQAYVVYDANGGTGAPVDSSVHTAGTNVTLLSGAAMTREGYTFDGWYDNQACTGSEITQITGIAAGTTTVYAKWTAVDTYTVTYSKGTGDGTVPVDSARYAKDDVFTLMEPNGLVAPTTAPAGQHYVFAGWEYNSTTYAAGSSIVMPAANVTITAQWTLVDNDEYVVFIDLAGGTGSYANTAYAAGAHVAAPATAPTRTGYTFQGWSYNGTATVYNAGATFTMPAANVTLVATWAADTAKVTYAKGSVTGITGTAPTDSTAYIKGTTFTVLGQGTLAKTNYAFTGWAATDNATVATYLPGSSYTISANLTLYPVFKAETLYTLSFNNNYAGGATGEVGKAVSGGVVVAPAAPTRADYAFLSWNTQADGLGTTYMPGSNVALYGDVTLYAQWESTKTYNVTFAEGTKPAVAQADIVGTDPTMTAQKAGAVIVLPANPYTIQNNADGTSFVMTGWSDGTKTYAPGSEYTMPDHAVTFTAQWTKIAPNQAYVVYNANGGVNPPVDYTVYAKNDTPAVKDPDAMSRDGYVFKGWATTSSGAVVYDPGDTMTALPAGTTELFAVWEAVPTYKVIYDANYGTGGTGNDAVPLDNNKYADSEIFEVKGAGTMTKNATATHYYVFDGWNTKADGSGTKIVPDSSIEVTDALRGADGDASQVTLYAMWLEVAFETYPVIYDLAGGTEGATDACKTQSYVKDAKVKTAVAPTRAGYTFRGWAYGSIDSGITYAADKPNAFPMPAETVYLIAIWDEQFTVTYNGNGSDDGTVTDSAIYYAGDNATVKANGFTKTGYSFAGWNTQPNGTGTTYMAGDTLPITGDVTLYAQWSSQYKIVFDDNLEGDKDDYVTINGEVDADGQVEKAELLSSAIVPEVPTFERVNYRFVGWYTTPDCNVYDVFYTNRTLANNNIDALDSADGFTDKTVTLYAKWQWAPAGTEASYEDKITIKTDKLDDGMYGIYYSNYIEAVDENYDPAVRIYRNFKLVSGELPAGLVLNSRTGEIYGVPTTVCDKTIVVRMTDDDGRKISEDDKTIKISIKQLPLNVDRNATTYNKIYGDADHANLLKALNIVVRVDGSGDLSNGNTYNFGGTTTTTKVTFSNEIAANDKQFSLAYDYTGANDANDTNHGLFTGATTKEALLDNLMYADAYATMAATTDVFTAGTVRQAGEDAGTYKISLADGALTADNKAQYAITIEAEFKNPDKAVAPATDTAKYIFTINPVQLTIDKTTITAPKTYGENDPAFFCNTTDVTFTGTNLPAVAPTITKDDAAQTVTITYANGIADIIKLPFGRVKGEDAGTYRIYLESTTPVRINSDENEATIAARYAKNYDLVTINATLKDKEAATTDAKYNFTIEVRNTTFTPANTSITYGALKLNDVVDGTFASEVLANNSGIGVQDTAVVKVADVDANLFNGDYLKKGTYDAGAFVFAMTNGVDEPQRGTRSEDTTANYNVSAALTVNPKDLTVPVQTVQVTKNTAPTAANIEALAKLNDVLPGDVVTLTVTNYEYDGHTYNTAAELITALDKIDANKTVKVNYSGIDGADAENYSLTAGSVTSTLEAYTAPSGGSTGGGGGGVSTYAITVDSAENGSVTSSSKSAAKGDTVTLTVKPDTGYTLETLTVTDAKGNEVSVTEKDGKYTFTMPASKVTVTATFMEDNTVLNFFVDVPTDAYYYEAVRWAVKNGITSGTSATTFSPNASCTRAQIVTFLWRAAGSPAPKGDEMPFVDVPADAYYYDAVLWAVEEGITGGTSATTFSPNATCTRAQSVTFLWRAQGSPAVEAESTFTDVTDDVYYADAVQWAVEEGITNGTSSTKFSPNNDCTRGQIVTFIWRALAE